MNRGAASRNAENRDVIRPPVIPGRRVVARAPARVGCFWANPRASRSRCLTQGRQTPRRGSAPKPKRSLPRARGLPVGGAHRRLPLHWSGGGRRLAASQRVASAFLTMPPLRAEGTAGPGPAADFSPEGIAAGARLIGIINPAMPDVPDGPRSRATGWRRRPRARHPCPTATPARPMRRSRPSRRVFSCRFGPATQCRWDWASCRVHCWRRGVPCGPCRPARHRLPPGRQDPRSFPAGRDPGVRPGQFGAAG